MKSVFQKITKNYKKFEKFGTVHFLENLLIESSLFILEFATTTYRPFNAPPIIFILNPQEAEFAVKGGGCLKKCN